jgi:hypothetical protein
VFSVFRVEKIDVSLILKREGFTTLIWNVDIHIEKCILVVLREMCRNESAVVASYQLS